MEVIEAYLPYAKGRQKPRSYKETERHLRIHAAPMLDGIDWRNPRHTYRPERAG